MLMVIPVCFVCLLSICDRGLCVYVAGVNHAVIRANVVVGVRPPLSNDDECLEEYRDLIVRCWNAEPDVRLHFKGR